MKTKKLSTTYKYIILSICYALIGLCISAAHAENSTIITGIESITREGQDHKKIIERNISTNDEIRTFAFSFNLDRDLGEPRSTNFKLIDNQSNSHEGTINKPREVCNAYNKPTTEDYYPCHVEATFPAKTYTDFQIEIIGISENKIDSFSGKMPELEINFNKPDNILQLKNISDQELEIASINRGNYLKIATACTKIAPKEICKLKLSLENIEKSTQPKDKIAIEYKTGNESITIEIEFNLGQPCLCPTCKDCKPCEENKPLLQEKTTTEMATSILPVENGKYKVMLFLKNNDRGQKLLDNYSVQLNDDNNEIHNLIIDKNTIKDQDCLELIGTRGCIVTFEGTIEKHKKSNKYMTYQVSVTYQDQFGTERTQSFSSTLQPEISCKVAEDNNGNYILIIDNLTGAKITIARVDSPNFETENKMTALDLYKGTPLRLPLPGLEPGSHVIQIYYQTHGNDKPKILMFPLVIIGKDSGHWYDWNQYGKTIVIVGGAVVATGVIIGATYVGLHPVTLSPLVERLLAWTNGLAITKGKNGQYYVRKIQ